MSIVLVSYEGEEVSFDERLLEMSEFLYELPDPYMKVHLSVMGIDSGTLRFIKEFFESCDYKPTAVEEGTLKVFMDTKEYKKIGEIGMEELLLLVLASHKLHIRSLQNLTNARIASMVLFEDYEAASEAFGLDVRDDEHLNNFLKLDNKWVGVLGGV